MKKKIVPFSSIAFSTVFRDARDQCGNIYPTEWPVTDVRMQRVEHIFRGELEIEWISMEAWSRSTDSAISFALVFRFFPGAVGQRRHAAAIHDGSVCTDQIQFPAAYWFFPFFFFFFLAVLFASFPVASWNCEKEGRTKKIWATEWVRKKGRTKGVRRRGKVARCDEIFYVERVHGSVLEVESSCEIHTGRTTNDLTFHTESYVRPSWFVHDSLRNVLTRLYSDVYMGESNGEINKRKKCLYVYFKRRSKIVW